MSHKFDSNGLLFREEAKRIKKLITNICSKNNWRLVQYNVGYECITAFIQDLNGNYVCLLKSDWNKLIDTTPLPRSECWCSDKYCVRIAKSPKDFTGGVNNFCDSSQNLSKLIKWCFKIQAISKAKRFLRYHLTNFRKKR